MTRGTILLIDDETVFREDLATLIRHEGYDCLTARNGEEGLQLAETGEPDIVVTDLVMPGIGGIDVVDRIATLDPECRVIVVTAYGMMETAVEAFRKGAADYLLKPVVAEDLFQKIERCLEHRQLRRELQYLRREISECSTGTSIVGSSGSIEEIRQLIARVGPASSAVLITGESGTGKELVARALHERGTGSRAPFIAVNCAALPHDIIESELFGHIRGAFTGAVRDKPGYFELANGGTLFLDEVCEMPVDLQPKLLRAIEHQGIFRVGGTQQVRTNVRIVAATNRNPKEEIAAKRLREDLYFRLSVVEIFIPPLRERRHDIPALVEYLLRRVNHRLKRHVMGVSSVAMRALMSCPWRGNVRELENVLERAVLLSDGDSIEIEALPSELSGDGRSNEVSDDLRSAVRAYEREHIRRMLAETGGNREETSRRLGIDVSTLYRRMKELSLS